MGGTSVSSRLTSIPDPVASMSLTAVFRSMAVAFVHQYLSLMA
ncbi:hypothetical protein HDF10_004249 [Edaphobacter lichenicola]|jgi:hypothetical protein|uniref:Uncharacterized protein n=1 Tax=Tunturiibacter lichenicola TaxID=2051959 RepID=A0A7W8JBJ1_9BACT|nr:hypothetical protein [Edaphobacter lichenicola]